MSGTNGTNGTGGSNGEAKPPEEEPRQPTKPEATGEGVGGRGNSEFAIEAIEAATDIRATFPTPRADYILNPERPTLNEVAARWGLNASGLRDKASKEGWVEERKRQAEKMARYSENRLRRRMMREEARDAKKRRQAANVLIGRGLQALGTDPNLPQPVPFTDGAQAARAVALGARIQQQEQGTSFAAAKRYVTDFLERLAVKFPDPQDRAKIVEVHAELSALYVEESADGELED